MKKIEPGQQIDQSLPQQQSQQLLLQISFVHTKSSTREKYCQKETTQIIAQIIIRYTLENSETFPMSNNTKPNIN